MDLQPFQTAELQDRFQQLVDKYIEQLPALIAKLDEFGKIRNELQLIYAELANRKSLPITEEDVKKIEALLKQYDANTDNPK